MKVRVTGYLNRFMIDLPVLDEKAELRYHKAHSPMNKSVSTEGSRTSSALPLPCPAARGEVDEGPYVRAMMSPWDENASLADLYRFDRTESSKGASSVLPAEGE